jgi:hypothetical protein
MRLAEGGRRRGIGILGAIIGWGSRALPGTVAAFLETLLERLALALGLSLRGASQAGGSRGGSQKDDKDKVPGERIVVPGETATFGEKRSPPSRLEAGRRWAAPPFRPVGGLQRPLALGLPLTQLASNPPGQDARSK